MFRIIEIGKGDVFFNERRLLVGKIVKVDQEHEIFVIKRTKGFYKCRVIFQEDVPGIQLFEGENIPFTKVKLEKVKKRKIISSKAK